MSASGPWIAAGCVVFFLAAYLWRCHVEKGKERE